MHISVRATAAATLIAALFTVTVAACGDDGDKLKAAAKASCVGKTTADTSLALPKDLPTDSALVLTSHQSAGATQIYFGALAGTDLIGIRDALATKLTAAGYTIKGKDQEPGAEAEAEFAGTHDGTIRVRNLCSGYAEIRYRIEK